MSWLKLMPTFRNKHEPSLTDLVNIKDLPEFKRKEIQRELDRRARSRAKRKGNVEQGR